LANFLIPSLHKRSIGLFESKGKEGIKNNLFGSTNKIRMHV